jgi:hypothetical protein
VVLLEVQSSSSSFEVCLCGHTIYTILYTLNLLLVDTTTTCVALLAKHKTTQNHAKDKYTKHIGSGRKPKKMMLHLPHSCGVGGATTD